MTLPNYFYGGPPKAGSSWIYSLLAAHPEVFVPDGKYVQFFTDFYDRGIDWYEQLYDQATPEQTARCDLTTDYLFVPEAAERLAKHIPDARVFFSLRNPAERDWSAYQHLLRTGQARGSLEQEADTAHRLLSTCSAYSDAIERSWRLFGKENTHILWFDDIKSNPQAAADSLHDFMGVSRRLIGADDEGAKNVARAARNPYVNGMLKQGAVALRAAGLSKVLGKLKDSALVDKVLFSKDRVPKLRDTPDALAFLTERHAAEIDRLETLLSRDLSTWRGRP
ncbi:sulfotransferase family protein [Roseobacter litoralis]|uniref:Sulfotransferase-like protein n=1 Tax=Roseobacter litoralis (strain ATCC 49566 / DSM 6996 / JCM 21268 / NBRC 15278 / OCh 149) TaxID=391595 RepID=F7ZK14_ROSLO|nr:sulfotransferase [Roseobacter litoralis]AEI92637.1 sulfotransferase-like protein [Roseobacter litoralis Och 149]